MIEDTFVRDRALQAANIEIRLLPEYINTMRTPTEEHFAIVDHVGNSVRGVLLGQAGRADDHVLRFVKTLFRVIGKQVNAALATEVIGTTLVVTGCRIVFADSQSDQ